MREPRNSMQAEPNGPRLRALYAGRPTKTIIVRAVVGVRYQDVVTAVDVARGAGVVAIGLASMKR